MKIIIAGDGKMGATLTRQLSAEGDDLTLIDSNPKVLESSEERYDVMVVQGNCASMDVLEQAGAREADLLIAMAGADEINLLCCMTAHSLNPKIHTIARVRNPDHTYGQEHGQQKTECPGQVKGRGIQSILHSDVPSEHPAARGKDSGQIRLPCHPSTLVC